MPVRAVYKHKGYSIHKYGVKKVHYKIFKPEGGSLNYDHYETLKAAKDEIDRVIVRQQRYARK